MKKRKRNRHLDEPLDLGPCCACGESDPTVRNIVAMHRRAPVPGTGWGCFQCGLPMDGASYVLCDRCLAANAPPRFVIDGYLAKKKRLPIENLSPEPFVHNMRFHPEVQIDILDHR